MAFKDIMKKEVAEFAGTVDSSGNIRDIMKRSTKAVCGVMEREVNVPNAKVSATKRKLKQAGQVVIGTSEPNGKTRKVWYIRRGGI